MGMQTPRGGFKILISTRSRYGAGVALHTVVTSFPTKGEADYAAKAINDRDSKFMNSDERQNALPLYPA